MIEKVESDNILDNFVIWKMAKDISLLDLDQKELLTFSELSQRAKVNRGHPYFLKLMDYLMKKRIITVKKQYGKTRVISLNTKELDKLIEENKTWNEFIEYVHTKKLIRVGV